MLAGRAGLSVEVSADVASRIVESRNITNSPQQAIAELERHYSLVAKVMDGRLIVTSRDEGQSVSGATVPIVVFTQEHFGAITVKHTERSSYTSVKAAYVDPEDYITKFVERSLPAIEGLNALPFVPGRKFNSKAEAEAAAKSQAQSLQRSRGEVDLQLAKGDPWLRDQQRVLIRGMREGMNGSYVTEIVSHTYRKEQGILTAAKAKPDSDGDNYEALFAEATPDFLRQNFLLPGAGGLIGSVLTLRGGNPNVNDLYAGVDPFQR